MITLILPGFSSSNKNWIDYLKTKLEPNYNVIPIYWNHWKTGGSLKVKTELEKINKLLGKDDFNIIAKSVGTTVAMEILIEYKKRVGKIILCGIPSVNPKRITLMSNALKDFNPKNIICFQNSKDPFVTYENLKKEIAKISKDIKVIEKPARNHDYYYHQDFLYFLK